VVGSNYNDKYDPENKFCEVGNLAKYYTCINKTVEIATLGIDTSCIISPVSSLARILLLEFVTYGNQCLKLDY